MTDRFIALDWGTSSFRAYLADASGAVHETVSGPEGILAVENGRFEEALERHIGTWDTGLPVVASGMITSRQGWIELPYLQCPADAGSLVSALHRHRTRSGRTISFATGLSFVSSDGIPDVMRGEEAQVFGSLEPGLSHFVTPGTHSKWIAVEGEGIARFATYMTGEVFALLKTHSILGRLIKDGADDDAAFDRGVAAAFADPAGFLHRIFSARSLVLFDRMPPEHIASYLSGQVIGTEVAHAISQNPRNAEYCVLASPVIGGRYVRAIAAAGLKVRYGDPAAAVKGLAKIAKLAGLIA